MKYMLDTNICIYLIRNTFPALRERFLTQKAENICISSITYAEMMYGVEKSSYPDRNRAALLLFLQHIEVLNWDPFAANDYGKIRASLEKKGTPISQMDEMIAAHAKSLGCTLVTHNTREFERVDGLLVEDWT